MKFTVLCCLLSILLSTAQSQILIRGRVTDRNHSKVTIFDPVNEFCNRIIGRQELVRQSAKEEYFESRVAVDFPVMITITIGMRPIWVFVEPGDTVTVDIDADRLGPESPEGGIHIEGKNGAGNTFYNTFNYSPGAKFNLFQHLLDSMNFRKTLDPRVVDNALSIVMRPFDSLLSAEKITKNFYNIVVNDTRNVLIAHLVRFVFNERTFTAEQALAFFDRIYDRYPLTDAVIRGGLYGTSPCHDYYYIKATRTYPKKEVADSIMNVGGETVFINSNLVPFLYAPADIRESLWIFELITLKRLFASQFGRRDVDAFLAIFPDGKMGSYLAPPYFNLSTGPTTFGDSSGYVFTAANHINSFDTLLERFKGQRLLVDLWATWCVPCKMEFSFNAPIDSFCSRHDICRLYVAFERGPTRNSVKRDAYTYNLKGFHVIANDSLINDMTRRIYPPNQGYVIPHYLLIDEKGEMVDKDAPRPSSADELMARMNTVFKLTK